MKTHQIGGTTYFYDGDVTPQASLPDARRSASSLFIPPTAYAQPSHTPFGGYTAYRDQDAEPTSLHQRPPGQGMYIAGGPAAHIPPSFLPPQSAGQGTPYRTASQLFISENLRQNLLRKAELQCPAVETLFSGGRAKQPPLRVASQYHSLRLLDEPIRATRALHSLFSEVHSEVYKCTNTTSGTVCILRRVVSPLLAGDLEQFDQTIEAWKQFSHPNAVALRNVVATADFSPNTQPRELAFEYQYIPGAITWEQAFLPSALTFAPLLKEADLWSHICQLVNLLKNVHELGLSCRCITPSKILVSPGNRVHVNCLGLLDVVFPQGSAPAEQLQFEDITALGELLLATACRSTKLYNLEVLKQQTHFSPALRQFISMLVTSPPMTVYNLLPFLVDRYADELTNVAVYVDMLESELQKELHNGRLFRLLCRLGFMNERPEYESDPTWSETGDRYILKLFRDYLFHQSDEKGDPRLDWGHLVTSLNKLDAGSEEKLVLGTRDGSNLLVVSFSDVKKMIEVSFSELQAKSMAADFTHQAY